MTDQKTAPGVATTQDGTTGEQRMDVQTTFPGFDFSTTEATRQPGLVEALLPHGEENAISAKTLVRLCGFRSTRQLRARIERERGCGALILSTCRNHGGYFLPSSGIEGALELEAYIQTLRARAVGIFRALRPARQALDNWPIDD